MFLMKKGTQGDAFRLVVTMVGLFTLFQLSLYDILSKSLLCDALHP
jgi:hypothetical protein